MASPKKSECCTAAVTIHDEVSAAALAAALTTEGADVALAGSILTVAVSGDSISELRARLNTALRSLHAASEALIEVGRVSGSRGGESDD